MRKLALLTLLAVLVPVFANADAEGYGKTRGLLGPILIGPKLSILRLPTGPTVGIEIKAFERWGLWFDYGYIPKIKVREHNFQFNSWNVGAKVYPFKGSFFVGVGVGQYKLRISERPVELEMVEQELVVPSNRWPQLVSIPEDLTITSTYLAPRLGWLWSWEGGFFMSLDLNWQITLRYRSVLQVMPSEQDAGNLRKVENQIDRFAKIGLPNFGLLEVGWLF